MSGKSRQLVRMSNLLEKSKHVNIEAIEDPTLINYLRLAECILDTNSNHKMSYYLQGLENAEEADKRIKKVEKIRKMGSSTEAEHLVWLEKFNSKAEKLQKEYRGRPVIVINPATEETVVYKNLRVACDELDLKYRATRSYMQVHKEDDEIKYKGLIFIRSKKTEK